MTNISVRLKNLRENKKDINSKWTQSFVAEKLGVARVTYTAYENGTKSPPNDVIVKLADLFEVSADYLLGRTDNPNFKENDDDQFEYYKNKLNTEFPDIDLMFKDMATLTGEDLKEIYEYIKFKMSQQKEK